MKEKQEINFTKIKLKELKPEASEYYVYDTAGYGLRLRIGPSGVKSFQVLKRVRGQMKTVTIGKFCTSNGAMCIHPSGVCQRSCRLLTKPLP